jgi:Flp pilus assembly protein TadB
MNPIIISAITGVCIGGVVLASQANYCAVIDFIAADLADRLRALRMTSKYLHRWIHSWLVIVTAIFLIIWLGFDAFPIAAPTALFLCAGPWYVVRRASQARRQKIEDQLADAMVMFSSGIRAGLSIPQALELLAFECPKPICQEFHQMAGEYKLGKPLERTLTEAKERLKSENFILFAAALLASRESGGRLNETVERISQSVMELQRLERKVHSETAQARKSAVYMAVVPLLLLVVYAVVDPHNTERLFTTLPGQLILSVAMVLNVVAYLWALKILSSDI